MHGREITGLVEDVRLALLAAEPREARRLLSLLLSDRVLGPSGSWLARRLLRDLAGLTDCWAEELERGPARETMLRLAQHPLFGPPTLH